MSQRNASVNPTFTGGHASLFISRVSLCFAYKKDLTFSHAHNTRERRAVVSAHQIDCAFQRQKEHQVKMGVFTYVCRKNGGEWSGKQIEGGDLEASAASTYELQRKLVQTSLSADSSGGIQSSFSLITPTSAVFQVSIFRFLFCFCSCFASLLCPHFYYFHFYCCYYYYYIIILCF